MRMLNIYLPDEGKSQALFKFQMRVNISLLYGWCEKWVMKLNKVIIIIIDEALWAESNISIDLCGESSILTNLQHLQKYVCSRLEVHSSSNDIFNSIFIFTDLCSIKYTAAQNKGKTYNLFSPLFLWIVLIFLFTYDYNNDTYIKIFNQVRPGVRWTYNFFLRDAKCFV